MMAESAEKYPGWKAPPQWSKGWYPVRLPRRLLAAVPSSSRTNTTKKAKATMAPTTLALVRRRNWRRARVSDALEWLAYARDSERRKARLSAAEDLDGVEVMEAAEEGALPDEMEREWAEPLVEGAFMVRVGCALLVLVIVLGALPMPMLVVVSPANVCAAAPVVLLLLANALDSRRVMPMPPVLLGEAAYRLIPPTAPPAPLPPTALDSGVALDL